MPIYEFYCKQCNTIFKFFSRSVNTSKIPVCPRCGNSGMEKAMSTFATISINSADLDEENPLPDIDENQLAKAMTTLEKEAEGIDEEDPRQAANLMRKMTEMTGLQMGPGMEEALNRLENGQDPDQIEAEMGDLLDNEDPFILKKIAGTLSKKKEPKRDDKLYDM
ncbi:MAG: zinc ribbon domain-containing protein [Calditrichaceae bacterium]